MTTPAPSCSLQKEDPDQQITLAYCVCDGETTLPVLPVSPGGNTESCGYKSLPASLTIHPTQSLKVTTSNCQVCTQVTNNEDSCSLIKGCTPTGAPTPSSTVAVSNNPVHVGNLFGDDLYNAVLELVKPKCPNPAFPGQETQCKSDGAGQNGVKYVGTDVDAETLEYSTITFTVEDSSYTSAGQRDAMLGAAASALKASATGKHCYDAKYMEFSGKGDFEHTMTVCDAANLISVWVFDQKGGIAAFMNMEVVFHIDGLSAIFDCEIVFDTIVAALDVRSGGKCRGLGAPGGDSGVVWRTHGA
jgi:hypothetical protein